MSAAPGSGIKMGSADDKEKEIPKVNSVPPGADDAYNAPTRVGPSGVGDWAALIKEAEKNSLTSSPPSQRPRGEPMPRSVRDAGSMSMPPRPSAPESRGSIPSLIPEDEEADAALEPTRVSTESTPELLMAAALPTNANANAKEVAPPAAMAAPVSAASAGVARQVGGSRLTLWIAIALACALLVVVALRMLPRH